MNNLLDPKPSPTTRPTSAGFLKSTLRVFGVVLGLFWLLTGLMGGDPFLHEIPLELLFGWLEYLSPSVSQMEISWSSIGFSLGLIAALMIGFKVLMSRLLSRRCSWSRSVAVVSLALILFVSGTAFTGLCRNAVWLTTSNLPWIQNSRTSVRRLASQNNLKQLALAAMNYNDMYQALPPGGTFDREGRGQHSWITHLLPHLDQAALHRRIDFDQPWHAPDNVPIMREQLNVVLNPGLQESHDEQGFAVSHYAGNSHLFGANRSRSHSQITDEQSQTILAGEVRDQFRPWGEPMNCRNPTRPLNTPGAFGSPTIGGVHFVMADGSVRFVSETISPEVLKALATPTGGEKLSPNVWEP
jgi:hypothetical protein